MSCSFLAAHQAASDGAAPIQTPTRVGCTAKLVSPSCHPLCWLGPGVEPARLAGDVAAGTCLFYGVFLRASKGKPFPGVSSWSLAAPGQDQDWHPACSAGVFQPALPNSFSGCGCGAPSVCGAFHLPLSPNLWSRLPSQRGSEGSGSGARLSGDWFLVPALRLTGQGCASREHALQGFSWGQARVFEHCSSAGSRTGCTSTVWTV